MDNQDITNIKVKRTKEDIRLYNRLYYTHVRKMMSIINIMLKNIIHINIMKNA